jgi:hypothetical protein
MTGLYRAALVAFAVGVALVFAVQTVWPDLFAGPAAAAFVLRLGAFTKLLLLSLAFHQARAATAAVEADNPARRPWWLVTLGLLGFALGQAVLAFYQVILGESPYPSPADVFFLAAYPFLVAALFAFIRVYRASGFPVGTPREHAAIGLALSVAFIVLGVLLLRPVFAQPGPWLEHLITAAYPAFDFILLVPVLLLLRMTARFRGGAVFRAWGLVLFGIVALCAADILYAYFQILGFEGLGPLVDVTYVLAYLGLALGASDHRRLLAG